MNKFLNVFRAITLSVVLGTVSLSQASIADEFEIPGPGAAKRDMCGAGALMPYTRYDSQYAVLSGGAALKSTMTMDRNAVEIGRAHV